MGKFSGNVRLYLEKPTIESLIDMRTRSPAPNQARLGDEILIAHHTHNAFTIGKYRIYPAPKHGILNNRRELRPRMTTQLARQLVLPHLANQIRLLNTLLTW